VLLCVQAALCWHRTRNGRDWKWVKCMRFLSLNINIQITFHTNNTLHDILKTRTNNTNKHVRSGIYQLQCQTCHLLYIGQTGRRIEQRYKEPTRYITSNKPQSLCIPHSPQPTRRGTNDRHRVLTTPSGQKSTNELIRKLINSPVPKT
jgi:hypothetical protein